MQLLLNPNVISCICCIVIIVILAILIMSTDFLSFIPGYSMIKGLFSNNYGRGAGRIPDKKPCAPNERDDGTSCWIDTVGRGSGYAWQFGDSLNDDGMISRCEADNGKGNCEKYGLMYYPKCKAGYEAVGCCLCQPKGGPGITKTAFDRYLCKDDEDLSGALCYPKCKTGYHATGCCICTKDS